MKTRRGVLAVLIAVMFLATGFVAFCQAKPPIEPNKPRTWVYYVGPPLWFYGSGYGMFVTPLCSVVDQYGTNYGIHYWVSSCTEDLNGNPKPDAISRVDMYDPYTYTWVSWYHSNPDVNNFDVIAGRAYWIYAEIKYGLIWFPSTCRVQKHSHVYLEGPHLTPPPDGNNFMGRSASCNEINPPPDPPPPTPFACWASYFLDPANGYFRDADDTPWTGGRATLSCWNFTTGTWMVYSNWLPSTDFVIWANDAYTTASWADSFHQAFRIHLFDVDAIFACSNPY